MKTFNKLFILLAFLLPASLSNANLLTNGDFEDKVGLKGKQWGVFQNINGWHSVSGAGIEVERNTVISAQSGNQYIELDSHNNSAMQQLVSDLIVGQSYDLSFWYFARTNNRHNDNGIDVYWGDYTPADLKLSIEDQKRSNFSNGWKEYTLSLTAISSSMFLTFAGTGWSNSLGGFIDNVSLTSSVPEPASVILFGLGIIGLVIGRRRIR